MSRFCIGPHYRALPTHWTGLVHGANVAFYMALAITIAVVVLLVALRLTAPPWPNFVKMGLERWGKKTTVVLFAVALTGAAMVLLIARR